MRLVLFIILAVSTNIFAEDQLKELVPENIIQEPAEPEKTIGVEDFFRKGEIDNATLNPAGDLVAYEKFGSIMVGGFDIHFKDIGNVGRRHNVTWIGWASDYVLLVKGRNRTTGMSSYIVFDVAVDMDKKSVTLVREAHIQRNGYVVDSLLHDPERILFAQYKNDDDGNSYTDVFRVALFKDQKKYMRPKHRINKNSGEIFNWITDLNHKLTIGVSYADGKPSVWQRKGRYPKLLKKWTSEKKATFRPFGMNEDETVLYAVTNLDSDTLSVVEFDLESFKIAKTLFTKENTDVSSIIMDESNTKPLAVTYLDDGKFVYEFLDNEEKQRFHTLQEQLPNETLHIRSVSRDSSAYLVVSVTPEHPGKLSLCRIQEENCKNLGSYYPWLDDVKLAKTTSFSVVNEAGLDIESFITLPGDNRAPKIPLIVMPHGGPVGVSDTSYFNSDVQWLARNGYAVLQVNYRGSGGYGKKFKIGGMQQWGRGIEDDIELSLQTAMSTYSNLDPDNICIYGGSYGGYSAVMSIIRSPEKYKCAASFAGVMDLTLLFNKSSVQNNDVISEKLRELVGDPKKEREELMKYSPVYQYEKINRPLMLIHGTKDERVDVEHSWRLRRMLKLRKIPHEWLIMDDIGHGFDSTSDIKTMYDKLIPFFDKYLKNPETGSVSSDVAAD